MLLAYHNDPAIKAKYLDRVRKHREADELIAGTGWDGHRGCAVGCTFEAYDHSRGPIEIGVPEILIRLEDAIFENLGGKDRLAWPEAFLSAIPVGVDLSMVWPRFALWLLSGEDSPLVRKDQPCIVAVTELYQEWCSTGTRPNPERFWAAESAAESAAWAARTAAESAAESAARAAKSAAWAARAAWAAAKSAAWAASTAARTAAWAATSAAESAAESAAKSAAWQKMKDRLLLETTNV